MVPTGSSIRKAPGQTPKLNDAHRAALMKMIEEVVAGNPWRRALANCRSLPVMEWMPLPTASQCAKVVMFQHPTKEEGIHAKG